jgi:hypothetical protein
VNGRARAVVAVLDPAALEIADGHDGRQGRGWTPGPRLGELQAEAIGLAHHGITGDAEAELAR